MKELFSNSHTTTKSRETLPNEKQDGCRGASSRQCQGCAYLGRSCSLYGYEEEQLYKLTHEQAIPYWKPNGKLIYFEKSELIAWIRQNKMQSKAQISKEAERLIAGMEVQACTIHHSLK